MRKLIPIVVTLILLVGAFAVYFLTQAKFGISAEGKQKADEFPDSSLESGQIFKPGSGAWSKQFDKFGNLYYQFKCEYYDPQPDGTVKVTSPVIQFFMSGGQMMQIEGKNGIIRFAQGTDKGVLSNSPTEPPRYGSLRDVVVKLFSSAAQQNRNAADMTMTMTNAQFDNDTYRLFTQEYVDESGKVWHEDEVPVTVSARDYAFTGSGLVLYWNDIDKQLKSLRIAHGTDLVLYDAGDLSPKSAAPARAEAPAVAQGGMGGAGTAPASPAPTVATTVTVATMPSPTETKQRYTATFYDHVRVIQGGEDLVKAERMDVDFSPKGEGGSPISPTSAPAPVAQTSFVSPAQSSPATAVTATQPVEEPIHIHWQGPMVMVPTDLASAGELAEGKAIVGLTGSPVFVHQTASDNGQATDLECDNLRYRTEDGSAHLWGGVVLKQTKADGVASTVSGDDLQFSRVTHSALFTGPGKTRFPDPNDPKSVLTADWEKGCVVGFYGLAGNETQIQYADLQGNVLVDHPRFRLSASKDVQLGFDDPGKSGGGAGGSPPLREITATGEADCVVHEAGNQDRRIKGEMLKLTRDAGPDGKLYASRIVCEGSVLAEQDNQQLTAERLRIDLLPATRKSSSSDELAGEVALDQLVASGNVVVAGKDDSSAAADQLEVRMVEDHPHVKLLGSPAMVKNKASTLTGWNIQFAPHDQTAFIDGPGTFDGLQQAQNPNEKPRPLKLTWQQSASLDGNSNRVLVIGGVHADSDDGLTAQSAVCDRVVATLADVALSTEPSTKPVSAEGIADGADFMKNKQIKQLSLEMEAVADGANQPMARVESSARDSGGYLLHRYDLLSRRIDFDPGGKRVNVNGPGGIVAVEQTPPGASATTQASEAGSAIGGSGNTAIGWKKRFTYDDAAHSATIEGDIKIVHQGVGPKAQSVTLEHADEVVADFYSEATTRPAALEQGAPPRLKQLTATGAMTVVSGDKTITCGELDFDPVEELLTCRHGQLAKVTVVDDNNLNGVTCDEAILNIKTNELKQMVNVTGQGR